MFRFIEKPEPKRRRWLPTARLLRSTRKTPGHGICARARLDAKSSDDAPAFYDQFITVSRLTRKSGRTQSPSSLRKIRTRRVDDPRVCEKSGQNKEEGDKNQANSGEGATGEEQAGWREKQRVDTASRQQVCDELSSPFARTKDRAVALSPGIKRVLNPGGREAAQEDEGEREGCCDGVAVHSGVFDS